MWSGSLLTNYSGAVTGAHQRIDRIAFKYVNKHDKGKKFPYIKDILHFEGKNGPDGIKAKSPSQDEPWHFFNPYNKSDKDVINFIENHYNALVNALKTANNQRSAFEAAWLAHAIVDGLTPAHHYPYEEELEKLRGEPNDTRHTIKKKIVISGSSKTAMIKNNWKMWGAKGLFTTHGTFELGTAMILMVAERDIKNFKPNYEVISQIGLDKYYRNKAVEIANLDIYKNYYKNGWTTSLSKQVKNILLPTIIATVTEVWLSALSEANEN